LSGAKWSARRVAAEVLYRVESREAYAGMALDSFFQKHPVPARERAFATELVYGALRRRNTLHWLLEQVSRRPLTEIDPRLLAILETAVYQLWFLSGSPEYAVVHEAVELARQGGHAGTAGFVNGVLRELLRQRWQISYPDPKEDPAGHLSLAGSHPRWLVERWLGRWGFSEVQRLCALNNQPPPVVIRVNTLRTDGAGLAAALARDGYICRPGRWVAEALQLQAGEVPLAKTSAWQDGLCQVQDESSMMASLVLDPRPGQFVLDVCSAPGGKTTHLAALMKNRGRLLAIDVHAHRLRLVAENCRRLGVSIVQTCPGDARRVLPNLPNLADRLSLRSRRYNAFLPSDGLHYLPSPARSFRPVQAPVHAFRHRILHSVLSSVSSAVHSKPIVLYRRSRLRPHSHTLHIYKSLTAWPFDRPFPLL
jgi:16S rRNA (cytosine967-C5)-methyltransferase